MAAGFLLNQRQKGFGQPVKERKSGLHFCREAVEPGKLAINQSFSKNEGEKSAWIKAQNRKSGR